MIVCRFSQAVETINPHVINPFYFLTDNVESMDDFKEHLKRLNTKCYYSNEDIIFVPVITKIDDKNIFILNGNFTYKYAWLDFNSTSKIEEMKATIILDNITILECFTLYRIGGHSIHSQKSPWSEETKLHSFQLISNQIIEEENETKEIAKNNKEIEDDNNRKKKEVEDTEDAEETERKKNRRR